MLIELFWEVPKSGGKDVAERLSRPPVIDGPIQTIWHANGGVQELYSYQDPFTGDYAVIEFQYWAA